MQIRLPLVIAQARLAMTNNIAPKLIAAATIIFIAAVVLTSCGARSQPYGEDIWIGYREFERNVR